MVGFFNNKNGVHEKRDTGFFFKKKAFLGKKIQPPLFFHQNSAPLQPTTKKNGTKGRGEKRRKGRKIAWKLAESPSPPPLLTGWLGQLFKNNPPNLILFKIDHMFFGPPKKFNLPGINFYHFFPLKSI